MAGTHETSNPINPPAPTPSPLVRKRNRQFGGLSLVAIVQTLLIAGIVGLFTMMFEIRGKEAETAETIKSLQEKVADLKISAATAQQLKALDDKITEAKTTMVTTQQFNSMDDKVADLKANAPSLTALENSATTQNAEITNLRNQVANINSLATKHEVESITTSGEIFRLRAADASTCEMLTKIRERLAILEATQKPALPTK